MIHLDKHYFIKQQVLPYRLGTFFGTVETLN